MIAGNGSPFATRVLEQLDLKKSTARAALNVLSAGADVERDGDAYVVVDPLFAEWIGGLREHAGEAGQEG